jgi:hypothetical protein
VAQEPKEEEVRVQVQEQALEKKEQLNADVKQLNQPSESEG